LDCDWIWIGFGLDLDWIWIGFGLDLDWIWIGFGLKNGLVVDYISKRPYLHARI